MARIHPRDPPLGSLSSLFPRRPRSRAAAGYARASFHSARSQSRSIRSVAWAEGEGGDGFEGSYDDSHRVGVPPWSVWITMTDGQAAVSTLTVSHTTGQTPFAERRGDQVSGSSLADRSVYRTAACICLPRWLRMVGTSPWLGATHKPQPPNGDASNLYRQQAATLAVALLTEIDRHRSDALYLRECVRASLIRWQLSLRGDGRPASRAVQRSSLQGPTIACVAQLLSEATTFQTASLLSDLGRHARWLMRRTEFSPSREAAAIGAIADTAVLVRDADLLRQVRARCAKLLPRQDQEGWFAERGGADIGRLSLTIDALARLYRQHEWPELLEPLRRAVRFLAFFVDADGYAGGCYGSCETGFLCPYGLESLASAMPEARRLATRCRRRWARFEAHQLLAWEDELTATLGASMVLAANTALPTLPEPHDEPEEPTGPVWFPRAGLAIFHTDAYHAVVNARKGGAIRVAWREGGGVLDDGGLTVISAHFIRTSGRCDPRTRVAIDGPSPSKSIVSAVTSSGILLRPRRERERAGPRFRQFLRRLFPWRRLHRAPAESNTVMTVDENRTSWFTTHDLAHDRFERCITFGDDWVRIGDRVHCRLPCQTVVCQTPCTEGHRVLVDRPSEGLNVHVPLYLDGSRDVECTRLYRGGRLIDPRSQGHPR